METSNTTYGTRNGHAYLNGVPTVAHGNKPARVYPTGDTYSFRCECGHIDGDYLVREYAIDGWREHAGLEPLINYPIV